ncbi:MAG: carboxypeptidase regulatory-like domain-containing protein, partial [ANME-2 cluster archaeon]|nr:carboxypeptidase regulatory-like domain-containing protein [ANME-2 cluster archaeon]
MKQSNTDKENSIVSEQSRCLLSTRFSTSGSVSKPGRTALDTGWSRNLSGDACRFMLRTGMLLAVAMLILLALAGAGSATLLKLVEGPGTNIGADTTNLPCGTPQDPTVGNLISLFNNADICGVPSGRIRTGANHNTIIMAIFVNNTVYPQAMTVTAYSGMANMYSRSSPNTAEIWYEMGYYNPLGASGNFIGLFNSTKATTTSATSNQNVALNFNGLNGTLPANMKLAIRVWGNGGGNTRAGFWPNYDLSSWNSSINVEITSVGNNFISGYILNASDSTPISGATVQTNTSLTNTTDSNGFYKFDSLDNGTYIINASKSGYEANVTGITKTISGANITNANITLVSLPKYLVSGYVKEVSTGDPISGATVTTNTSDSTSTDGSGYYSFSLADGTYLITASKSGYADNSITEVVNGAGVSNADILLSVFTGPSKVLVVTNRYVVLDDATTIGQAAGTGFIVPSRSFGDAVSGVRTTVNMYALVLDNNGMPLPFSNVTLTLKNPGGATDYTLPTTTD